MATEYHSLPIDFRGLRKFTKDLIILQNVLEENHAQVTNYEVRRTKVGLGSMAFHIFQVEYNKDQVEESSLMLDLYHNLIEEPEKQANSKIDFHSMYPGMLSCCLSIFE